MSHRDRYTEHRPLRSPLARLVAPSNGADADFREKARDLWQRYGIIVIWPDQQLPWDQRAMAENAATRLYGQKRGR
jgi:hypothetical protein